MTREALKRKKLPATPGVYFFLGARREILYIGKATSLQQRVASYFTDKLKETRSPLIAEMIKSAKTVEVRPTDSVLEALLLETNLIRTHKPRFNTKSRDDKSYNHVIITNEAWPRILVVRAKDLADSFEADNLLSVFGPFPSAKELREALKIIRRLFKFYDTPRPVGAERSKIERGRMDFNRQIGLYPKQGSRAEYHETIRQVQLFLTGEKKQLIAELQVKMMHHAEKEEFEEAGRVKRQLFALQHIDDVALLSFEAKEYRDDSRYRLEAYDIAHHASTAMVGVMTVFDKGEMQPSQYRKFTIKNYTVANDPGALKEVLDRRLTHQEWPLPQVIVVDGNQVQKRAAEVIIKKHGLVIPVAAVVKNAQHKPEKILASSMIKNKYTRAIILANHEAHRFAISFHRQRQRMRIRNIVDKSKTKKDR